MEGSIFGEIRNFFLIWWHEPTLYLFFFITYIHYIRVISLYVVSLSLSAQYRAFTGVQSQDSNWGPPYSSQTRYNSIIRAFLYASLSFKPVQLSVCRPSPLVSSSEPLFVRISVSLSQYPSDCHNIRQPVTISFCLSEYPSACQNILLSVTISVSLSEYSSVCHNIRQPVRIFFCLSQYPSACHDILLSVRISVSLSEYPSVCQNIGLFRRISVSLSEYLLVCQNICQSVRISIHLPNVYPSIR